MAPAHRARLPKVVRKKIQRFVKYFVFSALAVVTVWESYKNIKYFVEMGDAMKAYGFNGGALQF